MIDSMIQRLLEQAVDSPIKLQLLLMYYENPRMSGNSFQIAERIYRDIWSTREALRELAEDGILNAVSTNGEPVYHYRPRPDYIEPIFRLVQSYNEPFERDHVQLMLREVATYAPYRRATHGEFFFKRSNA